MKTSASRFFSCFQRGEKLFIIKIIILMMRIFEEFVYGRFFYLFFGMIVFE